jgi:RNA polymerase sigma-70 factor (ECF subfamily)
VGERRAARDERRTVRHILDGDRAAGEQLVTAHYPRVYRFLCHLTGSRQHAEDLAQQSFLKAWQALASFRGEATLATWLHRIAYREYAHWLRSRREHAPLDAADGVADPTTETTLDAILLQEALATLSADHREAFLLFHVQGLSISEVAAVLGVPEGTVKSRLFHARGRLRELLQESTATVIDVTEMTKEPLG